MTQALENLTWPFYLYNMQYENCDILLNRHGYALQNCAITTMKSLQNVWWHRDGDNDFVIALV